MSYDLPLIEKYRLYVIFIHHLPFDTGNLRYNAATMSVRQPGALYYINESEATYTEDVFNFYLTKYGHNFMFEAASSMTAHIQNYYNGRQSMHDPDYLSMRKSVLSGSTNSDARELKNIQFGSGKFTGQYWSKFGYVSDASGRYSNFDRIASNRQVNSRPII